MTADQFNGIFNEYRMRIFYFCNKRINHRQDSEDITSAVFIKLWEHKDNIDIASVKAYLMVTANRKCIDYWRTKHPTDEYLPEYDEYPQEMPDIHEIVISGLYRLIEGLPPQAKTIFKMRYYKGMRVIDIAAQLGITKRTVSNTIYQFLGRLRENIKNSPD